MCGERWYVIFLQSQKLISNTIITGCPLDETGCLLDEQSASIVIVASSLAFLTIGVVLGGLAVYLVLRVKARPQKTMSAASPPLPSPPVQYEDIDLVGEDIHLTDNKAYWPIVPKQRITTSLNAAYVYRSSTTMMANSFQLVCLYIITCIIFCTIINLVQWSLGYLVSVGPGHSRIPQSTGYAK